MLIVGTCPSCLPVGSIEWLIENGRQLELFGEEGVSTGVSGLESTEMYGLDSGENGSPRPEEGLPF